MIKLLVVGKIKETYWQQAIQEYQKRLSKYTKLEIIEVPDQNGEQENIILEKEKKLLLTKIKEKDWVITLEIEGIMMNSKQFAYSLEKWQMNYGDVVFIIGGSYGLHEEIKKRSNLALSFSKMTFPHQLFRVILLEQVYRSFKIQHNETYHK